MENEIYSVIKIPKQNLLLLGLSDTLSIRYIHDLTELKILPSKYGKLYSSFMIHSVQKLYLLFLTISKYGKKTCLVEFNEHKLELGSRHLYITSPVNFVHH